MGLGVRAKRFALIIDEYVSSLQAIQALENDVLSSLRVTYAGVESGRDIEASSVKAVLSHL